MKRWAQEHKDLLTEKYPVLPLKELVTVLPYNAKKIKNAAARYHLKKKGRLHAWRYEDELRLIELFPNNSNAEIGQMLGKSESAIMAAGFKLQLRKTEAFLHERSSKTFFKPGQPAWNKGMKGLDFGGKETRFKKGQQPHNTLPEGTVTVRRDKRGIPYQFYHCGSSSMHLHVKVWKDVNGQPPKGHCITFKDGDTMNAALENLECISRVELMKRNSIQNLPEELKQTAHLRGVLNRKIHKRIKQLEDEKQDL